ncbi:hypothetical protein [Actinokineospora iranica]|uniref:Uncharacterized protein n=1 Tax=Actinokineospora iranica TaxID=1271860 RepID=A0A1G6V5K4_9PSEU|nr:hypothetical protein [Actinokineospora iranica]SDD48146.1 hypothetical protein SAMN05216174_111227 [Actinokineospora iranica]
MLTIAIASIIDILDDKVDPRYQFLGTDWRYLPLIAIYFIVSALTLAAGITTLRIRGRVFGIVMGSVNLLSVFGIPLGLTTIILCSQSKASTAVKIAQARRFPRFAPPPYPQPMRPFGP